MTSRFDLPTVNNIHCHVTADDSKWLTVPSSKKVYECEAVVMREEFHLATTD